MKTLFITILFTSFLYAQKYYEYRAVEDSTLQGFQLNKDIHTKILDLFNKSQSHFLKIETRMSCLTAIRKNDYIIIKQRYSSGDTYTTPKIYKTEWIGINPQKN